MDLWHTFKTVEIYSSRFLKLLAGAYLGFPLLYFVIASVVFNVPGRIILAALLSPAFYLLCALAITTGYALWEMKRWSWYLFVFTNVAITYSNAVYALEKGQANYPILSFSLAVLATLLITIRVGRELNVPYLIPRIRWWESDPRHKLIIPTQLTWVVESVELHRGGEVLDLDMSGCFIKLSETIPVDTSISVGMKVFGLEFSITGIVVWKTESAVTHPRGIGVKFSALSKENRKALKAVDRRVRQIARLYRSARYILSEDDYFSKMHDLKTRPVEGHFEKIPDSRAS